jgi:hypothetical protein
MALLPMVTMLHLLPSGAWILKEYSLGRNLPLPSRVRVAIKLSSCLNVALPVGGD